MNIPTSSSFPGAELWQIQCAVATSEEEQPSLRTDSTTASLATTTTLQLRMCLPAVSLAFTLIESLPLLQTPLTSMLLHPASCNSDVTTDATTTDALLPTHGLLTLNQVRRAVPILADDAAAIADLTGRNIPFHSFLRCTYRGPPIYSESSKVDDGLPRIYATIHKNGIGQ